MLGSTALENHFDDLKQQQEAAHLGMWVFLSTEILLFGGVFTAYAVYRSMYPAAWAEGSHHNDLILGTVNTAVLLVSSLTMALAVHAAEEERWKVTSWFLIATIVLGVAFLGIKFFEYYMHWQEGLVPGLHFSFEGPHKSQVEMFMFFYFAMTLVHALHMTIGIGVVTTMAVFARREKLAYYVPIEITGLYWHLVDIVWVFLFPLLYLVS